MPLTEMDDDDVLDKKERDDGDSNYDEVEDFDESEEIDATGEDGGDGDDGDDSDNTDDSGFTDEEKQQYGKRVKKRINKVLAERNQYREQAEKERQRREQLEKENAELRDKHHAESMQSLEKQRETLREQLKEASAEADLERYNELNEKLIDVTADLRLAQRQTTAVSKKTTRQTDDDDFDDVDPDRSTDSKNKIHPSAKNWMKRNQKWASKPENSRWLNVAKNIELDLLDDGYEFSDELYEELDRRLEKAVPRVADLRKSKRNKDDVDDDGFDELDDDPPPRKPAPRRRKMPVSPSNPGNEGQNRRPNSRKLTQDDLKTMKRYGMDPNDPKARKAYLDRNAELS